MVLPASFAAVTGAPLLSHARILPATMIPHVCAETLAGIALEEMEIAALIAFERERLQTVLKLAATPGDVIESTAASRELLDRILLIEESLVKRLNLLLEICTCEKPPEAPEIECGCIDIIQK
jgi:hypothetical protein